MSQIESVLKKLEGTSVYDILINVENAYERISREQGEWYDKLIFSVHLVVVNAAKVLSRIYQSVKLCIWLPGF